MTDSNPFRELKGNLACAAASLAEPRARNPGAAGRRLS